MDARPYEEPPQAPARPVGPPEARREPSLASVPEASTGQVVLAPAGARQDVVVARDAPWRRSPAGDFRAGSPFDLRQPGTDADAYPVGFSPTGDALPDALTDVLLRGSHWVRSAQRAEAQRRERSAAIASHVEAQLATFLELCAEAELEPKVTVQVVRDVPRLARHRGEGRPRAALPVVDELSVASQRRGAYRLGITDPVGTPATSRPPSRRAVRDGGPDRRALGSARHSGGQLKAWPLLYWRCESFPSAGRSLHLFVSPNGQTFEGRDDPAPHSVLGRQVRVWPVDAPSIVEGMAEVDARRCALHLVDSMARLLWRAGVGL